MPSFIHIPLPLLLSRCSPTELLCTVQTCWMTPAALLCWLWAFCCSHLCWSWHWLPSAAWLDTSSWACVSSLTAAPSTRTCPPRATGGEVEEAAATSRELQRGRGRVACGCRKRGLYMLVICIPTRTCPLMAQQCGGGVGGATSRELQRRRGSVGCRRRGLYMLVICISVG